MVNFKFPAQISQDVQQKDLIIVKELNPTMFLTDTYPIRSVKNETVIEIGIPKQFAPSEQASMEATEAKAESAKKSSSMLMGGSMAINILLAGSLSLLWGLINSLQYVTHFPFLNVGFPATSEVWYMMMLQIASFQVIPTDKIK